MDDKAKSRQYFNRHSITGMNRNGYWSHDYHVTAEKIIEAGGKNHIDIGCGNGAFLAYLQEKAPSLSLSGLDYSEEMVRQSRKRIPEAMLKEGDAEDMPLPGDGFDSVSCHMSIHHYPHPEKALAEMHRILREGGMVLINDLTGPVWLVRCMNFLFRYLKTGDHAVYTRAEMEGMMKKAGFCKVESQMVTPFTYVCTGIR